MSYQKVGKGGEKCKGRNLGLVLGSEVKMLCKVISERKETKKYFEPRKFMREADGN
jgi:hypothetical protein